MRYYYLKEPCTIREISIQFKELLGKEEPYKELAIELWAEYALLPFLDFVSKHFADYTDEQIKDCVRWNANVNDLKEHPEALAKFANKIPTRCIAAFWLADDTDPASFRSILTLSKKHKERLCGMVKAAIEEYLGDSPDNELEEALQNQLQRLESFTPN